MGMHFLFSIVFTAITISSIYRAYVYFSCGYLMMMTFFVTQYLHLLVKVEQVHAVALGLRVLFSLPLMLHLCWAWPSDWRFDGDLPMAFATSCAAVGDFDLARWVASFSSSFSPSL